MVYKCDVQGFMNVQYILLNILIMSFSIEYDTFSTCLDIYEK